ncbi:MAG TPA: bifunctional phosphoribosylaminoimidazolecarboxamide formyltransferase/IMP cyclohydrolase [Pirellulales bacterium]
MSSPRIRRALISTSDKMGLSQFAKGLAAAGVEIYSTGGTGEFLKAEGIAVRDVAEYTGFPEMLDGRVKTLHPKIHGGILARHDRPDDLAALAQHGIVTFELVVITLYPFESTVARPQTTFDEAIEQIDVGGPSLIRAAAKNQAFVTVATDPEQYAEILDQVSTTGSTALELRRQLAQAAFARLSEYDRTIAAYLTQTVEHEQFPSTLVLRLVRKDVLRYGENPHQHAALYSLSEKFGANLVNSRQLNGKELSYNNLLDLDSALAIVRVLAGPSVVVIKHNNPCGASTAESLSLATRQALDGDPLSAFGSVLALNRVVDAAAAEVLVEPGRFIEAIVAPDFDAAALEILTTRPKWKDNVRLLRCGPLAVVPASNQYRQIEGGLLVQDADNQGDPEEEWRVASQTTPGDAQWSDLRFAWALVRHVKSNAITVVKQKTLLGCGAGQMSRVDSVGLSLTKAGDRAAGAVMGSDAFFPFADSIEQAAAAGITAVIQPGGSRRDEEVIAAADAHGMAMIFTGRRHFKH